MVGHKTVKLKKTRRGLEFPPDKWNVQHVNVRPKSQSKKGASDSPKGASDSPTNRRTPRGRVAVRPKSKKTTRKKSPNYDADVE
jgi:hypothetical protein